MVTVVYKSKDTAFNGIWLWIQSNRYDLIKARPVNKETSNLNKLIKRFLIEMHLPYKKQTSSNYNNVQTQFHFKKFKKWILEL